MTLTNGTLTGYTEADVWTVGVNADGSYTFSTKDGKKLSMGASYGSTPLDDVNTAWKVSAAATTGCYYIQNAVRGNYLEWYAEKNNWSSYSRISDELLFAQAFYRVRKSGIVTSLSDGDTVVVFNPANGKALSTEYSGFYNKGTDVTLADGKLSGYTKADIWTVGVNADGTYTFSTSEGKKTLHGRKLRQHAAGRCEHHMERHGCEDRKLLLYPERRTRQLSGVVRREEQLEQLQQNQR